MFETFSPPAFYACNRPTLALHASGRTSGLVFESGYGVSTITPIYESHAITSLTQRFDFAGKELSEYMGSMLASSGLIDSTNSQADELNVELFNHVKERHAYVASDYQQEIIRCATRDPPQQRVQWNNIELAITDERFRCGEVLFQPSLSNRDDWPLKKGLHKSIDEVIHSGDCELKETLYANIVLSGGTTMLPGFAERMQSELAALAPSTMTVKVIAPPERQNSVWIGGSILTSLSTFQSMWISKEEYDEFGPTVVHRKCF
jgi:actin-related protein